MRTRALYNYIDETGTKRTNVVWFGSTGILKKGYDEAVWDAGIWDEAVGTTIFYNDSHSSFSEKQQGVVDSLTQRLSVIRRELWYAMSYGLPLFEQNRSKTEFDAFILKVVTEHPDVDSIISFSSKTTNNRYTCDIKVQSRYGVIDIAL